MADINIIKNETSFLTERFSSLLASMTEDQKAEYDKTAIEFEKKQKKEYAKKRFENCGIGFDYFNCSFNNFNENSPEQKVMKSIAMQFCDFIKNGYTKNLILTGDSGTGKTHIAVAILHFFAGLIINYIYDQPIFPKIRYATVSEISDEFRMSDSFNNNKTRELVVKEFADYDVMVIDEVGRLENYFENETDLLFRIIDKRYQNGKSTVLVTNLNKNELFQVLNKATTSRLTAFNRLMYFETKNIKDQRNLG